MPSTLDNYRSAKLLVDQHGEDAGLEAAMRADARGGESSKRWRSYSGRSRGRGRGSGRIS